MKRGLWFLTAAIGTIYWMVPGTAQAQPIQGFYAAAGIGVSIPFATKVTPLTPGFAGTFNFGQSPGYDGRLGLGYALGNGWRFEVESTLGRASVNGSGGTGFPATASGTVFQRGVMFNAIFDLDVGSPWVYPYLGLGVGYRSTQLDNFTVRQANRPLTFTSGAAAGGLAMQAIVGASFPIPNMPGLSITAEYHLTDILGGQKFNGATTLGALSAGGTAKYANHWMGIEPPGPAWRKQAGTRIVWRGPAFSAILVITLSPGHAMLREVNHSKRHASTRRAVRLSLAAGVLLLTGCSPVAPVSQLASQGSPSLPPLRSQPSTSSSVTFTVTGTQANKVALVVRFVIAFDAARLDDASALFADEVDANISDCDYATHVIVTAQGLPAIRAWLVRRFADHDRLVIARIFNMNPDSDQAVGVDFASRSSDTIARLGAPNGLVPKLGAKVVFDASGQRIGVFANAPGGADPAVVLNVCSVSADTSPPVPAPSG